MSAAGTISPDKILHDMAELWVTLGKQGEGEAGVLRACSMTLAVAAEEADDPQGIGETLAALMQEHPSRAIVIRVEGGAERSLSARVFSQCWMPFGQRKQICCEQIEITASDASLPDLPPVVVPLRVPDLPVMLWCRSARLFRLAAFADLAAIAQKTIVDSAEFGNARAALGELSGAAAAGRVLADLAWTRLTRWRELIAQVFENRGQVAKVPAVSDILITYRAAEPPTTAFYFAAWLLDGIGKLGGHARVEFKPDSGEQNGRLSLVEMRAGGETIASIALADGPAADVQTGDLMYKALLPALTDCSLMREELAIPGRDAGFDGALAAAARLALG